MNFLKNSEEETIFVTENSRHIIDYFGYHIYPLKHIVNSYIDRFLIYHIATK